MTEPAFDVVVHATFEAGFKVGGIGAVLDGLLQAPAYCRAVRRTILVGPMDTANATEMARLTEPHNRLEIIYSSWHQIDGAPAELSAGLRIVESVFRVNLLYGRRSFGEPAAGEEGACEHEVLLVDARLADLEETNSFKSALWQHYRIESDRYEWNHEFDLVIKGARPALAALNLLVEEKEGARCLLAHEWMGIPLAFCAQTLAPGSWRLVFYAHEMATARALIEDHSGHDTRFYNVLQQARAAGLTLDQVFGDRSDFFKHALIMRASRFDNILAVGQWVEQELNFLGGNIAAANIDLVYNGVGAHEISLEERTVSSAKLRQYCSNLLGYLPDYVFTHVTRMVISKGLWRDIRVLEHLDRLLDREGKRAVLFMLTSTEPAGRAAEDVRRWEMAYGWPVVHHVENGDLMGHEEPLYRGIEAHNARSRAIKIVLVNQFGWSRDRCGVKMPAEMQFDDIRRGTDLEFGQSIYEPFGISQVEPLGSGALSVVSNVCGCIPFVQEAARQAGLAHFPNLLQADYTTLTGWMRVDSAWEALGIDHQVRDRLESANSRSVARAIFATLPVTDKQVRALLKRGQRVSRRMSWDVVAQDYLLPALARAA